MPRRKRHSPRASIPSKRYRTIIPVEGRVSEDHADYGRRAQVESGERQLSFKLEAPQKNGSEFRDPAFTENRTQPLHRWVPWIAGFSAQFVEDTFQTFLSHKRGPSRPCVLDPFAGVGTTIVQAFLKGFDTIGFDINPYAALACKVKLNSPIIDVTKLQELCVEYQKDCAKNATTLNLQKPSGFTSRIPFFSPSVEEQVMRFLNFLDSIEDPLIADVFRVAFGSVMVRFSNYTYEPSLGSRPAAGKPLIEKADVPSIILGKLHQMVSDICWVKEEIDRLPSLGRWEIHDRDFLTSLLIIHPNSVDLVVTSPPYMNNYHYVRNTRPQLFWLSLISSPSERKTLEEQNFGKYWQTVRDREAVNLQFQHPELARLIDELRNTRRDKGPYGGPGWANYVATYFNDSCRFLSVLKPILKRNGIAVVVIGNSIIQGHEVKTDLVFADIAERVGFDVVGVQCIRTKRVGASITQSVVRRGSKNKAMLYDSAVIVRKK